MRRVTQTLALLALALTIAGIATVAKDDKAMTWKGHITDSVCGTRPHVGGSTPEAAKTCGVLCVKQMGASWVFVDAKTNKVVKIHNQDIVNTDKDLGVDVTVTGHLLPDGTIQVAKIAKS